jgi:hypothetical protein
MWDIALAALLLPALVDAFTVPQRALPVEVTA